MVFFWISTKETNFWRVWDFWADSLALFSHIKACRKIFFWKIIFRNSSFIIILYDKYVSFGQHWYGKYHTELLVLFFKMFFLDRPNFWICCRYLWKIVIHWFSQWLQFKQLHIYSLVKFLVILCKILDCRYQSLNMNEPVQSFQAKDVWTWIV